MWLGWWLLIFAKLTMNISLKTLYSLWYTSISLYRVLYCTVKCFLMLTHIHNTHNNEQLGAKWKCCSSKVYYFDCFGNDIHFLSVSYFEICNILLHTMPELIRLIGPYKLVKIHCKYRKRKHVHTYTVITSGQNIVYFDIVPNTHAFTHMHHKNRHHNGTHLYAHMYYIHKCMICG